ncbi:hypothetical protein Ddc_09343 [Ditylenchus destructor]|nr:hypothetical protein Ddc_09343 [Ditylenchus destructor]
MTQYFLIIFLICAAAAFQIQPEKPTELKLRVCSHNLQPSHEETMMFFPNELRFCLTMKTSKTPDQLKRDSERTTFLQSTVSTTLHEIGSPYRCQINFMGYGGEYRLTPDLGYYPHCQKSLSLYTNELLNENQKDLPVWNISHPSCPIQALPNSYRNFLSCELNADRWYELLYTSSIHYEVFREHRLYHQLWANHSTTFMFKTDKYVERAGPELYWLQKLIALKVKRSKDCSTVRYLLKVDDAWPLRMRVFIDYQVRENAYIKHLKHVGNGTLDQWFSGTFSLWPAADRTHEICAQVIAS